MCVVTRAMDQQIGSVIYMYDQLGSSSISWRCLTCDLSNFGPYVRNSPVLTSDLDDTPLGYVLSQSVLLAVSSPLPPRHRRRGYKQPKLKHLLNANYKSLNNKGGWFQKLNLIDSGNPDIVVATETWLSPDKTDGEVRESGHFCRDYIIHRRYRQTPSRGEGVFITVLNDECKERESEFKLEWLSIKVCGEMENHPWVTWALRRLMRRNAARMFAKKKSYKTKHQHKQPNRLNTRSRRNSVKHIWTTSMVPSF